MPSTTARALCLLAILATCIPFGFPPEPTRAAPIDSGAAVAVQNGRFGSRFNLDIRFAEHPTSYTCGLNSPVSRNRAGVYSGVEGTSKDSHTGMILALRGEDGLARGLPGMAANLPLLDSVTSDLGLTYHSIRGSNGPVELHFTIISPFAPSAAPDDAMAKMSSAPLFYLQLTAVNRSTEPYRGEALLALGDVSAPPMPFGGGAVLSFKAPGERGERALYVPNQPGVFPDSGPLGARFGVNTGFTPAPIQPPAPAGSPGGFFTGPSPAAAPAGPPSFQQDPYARPQGGLTWQLLLPPGGQATVETIYAAYSNAPVIEDQRPGGGPRYFAYTADFGSIADVLAYGIASRTVIFEASAQFEDRLTRATLDTRSRGLIAMAVHSYMNTTFLLRDRPNPGPLGAVTFTAWEGDCRYHSTVDVAHETAVFEGQVVPWALRNQIEQWLRARINDRYGPVIPHDIGYDTVISSGQAYTLLGGNMAVEETANVLLLTAWYVARSNDQAFLAAQSETLKALAVSLQRRDANGDGIADRGAFYTTIDLQSALHVAAQNSYIGVKQAAAYLAIADLLDTLGQPGADAFRADAQRIATTLQDAVDRYGYVPTLLPAPDWPEIIADNAYTIGNVGDLTGGGLPSGILGDGLLYPMLIGMRSPIMDSLVATISRSNAASQQFLATGLGFPRLQPDTNEIWFSKLFNQQFLDDYIASRRPELPRQGVDFIGLVGDRHDRFGIWAYTDAWSVDGLPVNLGHYPRGSVSFARLALPWRLN